MRLSRKTTLFRMRIAAHNEARRLEIIEDGWVREGILAKARPERVRLRDDFAGIVRLIDIIQSDVVMLERLQQAVMKREIPPPAQRPDAELVPVDEETADQ